MEQKIKFILIGLIAISAVFIFLFVQALSSKQMVIRQLDDLAKENSSLSTKVEKLQNNIRDYEKKMDSLNSELDAMSKEKEETEKKYELANKAKDELVEKLKSQQAEFLSKPQVAEVAPEPTDAYWAGILRAKTELEMQFGNIRSELKTMQINNEQLQRERSALELEVTGLKREKVDMKRQLDYNQKLLDSISQDFVREKNDKTKIQDTFKSLRNENVMIVQQLKSLNNRKMDLERKLKELQEQKTGAEQRFTEMQAMLTEKLSQIGSLNRRVEAMNQDEKSKPKMPLEQRESVELPTIVVRPQLDDALTTPLTGKVLAVNRDNNFIIVDMGEGTGLKVGNKLRVDRNGQNVADVEVIQTRNNISACDIKKEIFTIQVGDTVFR